MNFDLIKLFGMAIFSVVMSTANAVAAVYVVQDGDTLSKIAAKTFSGKIYGKDGGIEKLLTLNPKIKNPNQIFPGDKINISNDNQKRKIAESSPEVHLKTLRSSESHSLFDIQPRFFYTRLDGIEVTNDSAAVLLSKLNYGLDLSWRQLWTNTLESFVSLGLAKLEFTESSTRTLEGSVLVKSDLEVGVRLQLYQNSGLLFSAGIGEEIFYRATTANSVRFDSLIVPKLNTGITHYFFNKKPFSLGVEAKLRFLLPAKTDDYNVKSGWGYLGRAFIKQEPKNSNLVLQTGIIYGQHFQNTSIVNLKRSDLGVDLRFSWSFGI